jgi:hypothetical protein
VERPDDDRRNRSLHGLSRTLINNMVVGVTEGYKKTLEIVGVGYRVAAAGNNLEFALGFSHPVVVEAPEGMGFNANISYNSPPQNCSSHDFPNGINLAEFIVNNPFQGIYGQETIDISCVAGANAKVKFTMTADDWTSDYGSITKIKSFENNEWDNNTGLVGVFPYGCDNCTSSDNPPSCVGKQPEYVNKKPICNVQRPCEKNDGGEIEIILVDLLKM